MTREEQMKEAMHALKIYDNSALRRVFALAVEWADRTMLDKACKWLEDNYEDIGIRWMRGYTKDDFVEQFKQAMKVEL